MPFPVRSLHDPPCREVTEERGTSMEEETGREKARIPVGQVVFDEIFLWFLISIVVSIAFYNVWGLFDLMRTPLAP